MAKDKNSFVLYSDIIHTVKHLTDVQAGQLFKHLLAYVNDVNPVVKDPVINIAFEPIKQQLKRDLKKYEDIKNKRSEAGKKSAKIRKQKASEQNKQKPTSVEFVKQKPTNPTVNVNVNDNVINNKESIIKKFKIPTVNEVAKYCKERNNTINPQKFIDFYESKGWMVGKNKMKNWKAAVRNWEPTKPVENKKEYDEEGREIIGRTEDGRLIKKTALR